MQFNAQAERDFPRQGNQTSPVAKHIPLPASMLGKGRIGPIAMLRGSRPSTKLCEGMQYRHPSQTSGRSSTLNSVRSAGWPLRTQPSNSTFVIDHYFGERKAHEEGSSCFLRRRGNGHDCSLRTDTG
jgi:hypothetical protein